MARAVQTKPKVRADEYRTDGKRLVRVLYEHEQTTWVEDARTLEWEEIVTKDLVKWKVVREAPRGE